MKRAIQKFYSIDLSKQSLAELFTATNRLWWIMMVNGRCLGIEDP
ncbi:MAG: hypothetical protein WCL70_04990 [Paludibacter sp.]